MAEIFNAIVLSSNKFIVLHKQRRVFQYPEHKKYLEKMKKYWQESKDIDEWITRGFNYLKEVKR